MLAGNFGWRLSGFDLTNDLEFELFGKLSALETHLVASFWLLEAQLLVSIKGSITA